MNDAISALRGDLAEIARTLSEASPRRALEALEGEVRVLASRLDVRNRSGNGTPALATLEKGLTEVRDALRGLTPAENLAGAVDAIHALSQKIDLIAAGHQDPASMQQLETAISGLRSIASHAASGEAVTALTAEVRALAERIDAGSAGPNNDTLKTLETRIGMIADAIEQVRASGGRNSSPDIDQMVRTLGDKIERLQDSRGDGGLVQLDGRINDLVRKLEASESKLGRLDAIERGMKELLGYIAELRSGGAKPAVAPAPATAKDVRRTEQSLEAVHDTIGDVVDRLAMIETGIRNNNPDRPAAPVSAPAAPPSQPARPAAPPPAAPPQQAMPQVSSPPTQPATPVAAVASYSMQAAPRAEMPRATPMQAPPPPPPPKVAVAQQQQMRPAADGTLPYDFPLEPGSGKPRPGMAAPASGNSGPSVAAFRTPAERIATSKASLEPSAAAGPDNGQPKSNFIEAARRAAQFAADTQPMPGPSDFKHAPDVEPAPVAKFAGLRKHAKSVLVGASVLILIAAAIHFAVGFLGLNGPEPEPAPPKPQSRLIAPDSLTKLAPASTTVASGAAGELMPEKDPFSIAGDDTARTRIIGQTSQPSPPAPKSIRVPEHAAAAAPSAAPSNPENTGAVSTRLTPPPAGLFRPGTPRAAILPPSIGSRVLVMAAESGDPAAAFEVATRYSEGRGVATNLDEAAVWFERAARSGLTPAIFRLGGLYEKGIGVKKDLKRAHALYSVAAERGSAKAMHNLAVLYAEGLEGKPDYPNALTWFRKAADRGVADSQFNLGVLYARGIGVEVNLAESCKWFSLAAQSGDRDAAQKRDDVGKRLDPQTLKAVQAGVQNWRPEPQPEEAVSVHGPAGGWDQAMPLQQTPATPAKAKSKTAGKRA
jgi:localization factor PodJL